MNQRVLKIDGTLNFRDLGGYTTYSGQTVRWGKVYRSAQLDRLSTQGVTELAALDIRTVVDLRFTDESGKYPTIQQAVPNAEMLSWHDEQSLDGDDKSGQMIRGWRDSLDSGDPEQVREAMRLNYPQKLYSHRAIYRKLLLRLSEGNTPLIFHCAAGKDRTGVAAALVLSLLGVDDAQIIEDYLLTQQEIEGNMHALLAGGATTDDNYEDFQSTLAKHRQELLKPLFDADRIYIETLLNYVNSTYGDFSSYATLKLRLSSDYILKLKEKLLE